MKLSLPGILIGCVLMCSACTISKTQQEPAPMLPPKPLAIPVGKNWQVQEEAPKLRDERDRVYFQTEQSVQPEGATPTTQEENKRIQTPR